MKYYLLNIFFVFSIIILASIMVFAVISFVYEENNIEETQSSIAQVKLLDRHITIDNEYEILYAITYSNGLTLQVWKQVNYNDYIELWEGNKYDENAFIN